MNQTGLAKYDAARYALSIAVEVDEVKDIRDKAEAMAAYARQAQDKELLQWATEIKVRAERRAGEMLAEMPKNLGAATRSHDVTAPPKTLADIGITKNESSRWQKLAAVSDEKFEQAVTAAKEIAGEVTTAYLLKVEKTGNIALLHTGDEESYTPSEYIESARLVMGGITIDPASNDIAQKTVKADTYFTIDDDGLSMPWSGTVWMNPPYTALVINKFLEKAVNHYRDEDISAAIILTNNNTDTSWFHNTAQLSAAICFTAGRINFLKRDGSKSSPTNGQIFFYLGHYPSKFKQEFSKYGLVMVKAR